MFEGALFACVWLCVPGYVLLCVCACVAVCADHGVPLEAGAACCNNQVYSIGHPAALNDAIDLVWDDTAYGSCGANVRESPSTLLCVRVRVACFALVLLQRVVITYRPCGVVFV